MTDHEEHELDHKSYPTRKTRKQIETRESFTVGARFPCPPVFLREKSLGKETLPLRGMHKQANVEPLNWKMIT